MAPKPLKIDDVQNKTAEVGFTGGIDNLTISVEPPKTDA